MSEAERLLVLVEDDEVFAKTLKRSLERRGYRVLTARSHDELVEVLKTATPTYAVVDLKLGGASGLSCIQTLHAHDEATVIVVLTGFASIATAVEAIKLGASHYLAKPASTDDIEAAFGPPPSRRWSGSASTRPWRTPASTSPRPRGASACTGAPWPESWPSGRWCDIDRATLSRTVKVGLNRFGSGALTTEGAVSGARQGIV